MHLVDEQQGALAGLAARTRGVEHLLEIGDTGKHRRDLFEMQFGGVRKQARHRGLSSARRTPEHQRPQRARLQHPRQRAVGPQDVILPDHIGKRARTQLVRQRMRCILLHAGGGEQRRRRLRSFRAHPPSTTESCWPPRTTVMRHSRLASRVTRSRSLVLAIFCPLTELMMSPFWKPTLEAEPSSEIEVMMTPSIVPSRCSSSASAGEMFATLAPWNGERDVMVTSSRPVSGAVSSGIASLTVLPARCTSTAALPPNGRVAKR